MSDNEDYSIDSLSDFENDDFSDIDNIDEISLKKSNINDKSNKSKKTKKNKDDLEDLDYSANSDSDSEQDDEDFSDNEDNDDDEDDDIENIDSYDEYYENENDDEETQTSKIQIINDEETIMTTKSENKIIDKSKYISRPILTIYEYTKIISKRTTQILNGAKIMLKIPEDEINNYTALELSKLELKYKVSPFKIIRTIGAHNIEIWDVNELTNNFV